MLLMLVLSFVVLSPNSPWTKIIHYQRNMAALALMIVSMVLCSGHVKEPTVPLSRHNFTKKSELAHQQHAHMTFTRHRLLGDKTKLLKRKRKHRPANDLSALSDTEPRRHDVDPPQRNASNSQCTTNDDTILGPSITLAVPSMAPTSSTDSPTTISDVFNPSFAFSLNPAIGQTIQPTTALGPTPSIVLPFRPTERPTPTSDESKPSVVPSFNPAISPIASPTEDLGIVTPSSLPSFAPAFAITLPFMPTPSPTFEADVFSPSFTSSLNPATSPSIDPTTTTSSTSMPSSFPFIGSTSAVPSYSPIGPAAERPSFPVTASQLSFTPTASPIVASNYLCQLISRRLQLNNENEVSSSVLRYAYNLETSPVGENQVSESVLPALETNISATLLALTSENCAAYVSVGTDVSGSVLSMLPQDVIVNDATCTPVTEGNDCSVILGGMTVFNTNITSDTNGSDQERAIQTAFFMNAIEKLMNKGYFDDAHPDIAHVTFRGAINNTQSEDLNNGTIIPDSFSAEGFASGGRRRHFWIVFASISSIVLSGLCLMNYKRSRDTVVEDKGETEALALPEANQGEDERLGSGDFVDVTPTSPFVHPFANSKSVMKGVVRGSSAPESDYFV